MLNSNQYRWIVIAGLAGATAVGLGAIGAHALEPWLKGQTDLAPEVVARRLENFKLAAHYQLLHSLALLGSISLVAPSTQWARWLWLAGIVLFSGGLYAYALTGSTQWAHIVPVGGVALIVGWIALAVSGWHTVSSAQE